MELDCQYDNLISKNSIEKWQATNGFYQPWRWKYKYSTNNGTELDDWLSSKKFGNWVFGHQPQRVN